jgi:hypothetical protein
MFQRTWRKFWLSVAVTVGLTGCVLNPQPEPPGSASSTGGKPFPFNQSGSGGEGVAAGAAGGAGHPAAGGNAAATGGMAAAPWSGGAAGVGGAPGTAGRTSDSTLSGSDSGMVTGGAAGA